MVQVPDFIRANPVKPAEFALLQREVNVGKGRSAFAGSGGYNCTRSEYLTESTALRVLNEFNWLHLYFSLMY